MSDLAGFSRAVDLLYAGILEPVLWPAALEACALFVGGSSALLFHQDFRKQTGDFLQSWNADPHWTRLYFDRYVALNPVLPHTAFMDAGSVGSFLQIIDEAEFKRSQFYLEWAAPQSIRDVVVTILEKSATATGILGVTFLESDGMAGRNEIKRMEEIAPHARRAVGLSRLFGQLAADAGMLREGADALPDAIVFLDAEGRVIFANAAARNAKNAPFHIEDSSLRIDDRAAAARLRDTLATAQHRPDAAFAAATLIMADRAGRTPWIGQLAPVSSEHAGRSRMTRAAAILSLRPIANTGPAPMDALAARFRFTPRELQVFLGIVQFGGVPEVARIYGLSQVTVRTHLQNIFDKTGVRNQKDLVKLATGMQPRQG